MTSQLLVLPMAAHVLLTASLYLLLTVARAPSVWGIGRLADGSNPWARFEPRISANLSNQFEWPVFFHAACLVLLQHEQTGGLAQAAAWAFIGGRLLHSVIQVLTNNIRLRGLVFTLNFLAVLVLWTTILLDGSTG